MKFGTLTVVFTSLMATALGQDTILNESFHVFKNGWKTYNTVDYSSLQIPAWWQSQHPVYGPDSTPVVGISMGSQNPEFISKKLGTTLKSNRQYKLTLWLYSTTAENGCSEILLLGFPKNARQKPSSLKLTRVLAVDMAGGEELAVGWTKVEVVFRGVDARFLMIGPFDALQVSPARDTGSALLLISGVLLEEL